LYSTIHVRDKSEVNTPLIEINNDIKLQHLMKSCSPEPGFGYINKLKLLSSIDASSGKKNNMGEANETNISNMLKSSINNINIINNINNHKRNSSEMQNNNNLNNQFSQVQIKQNIKNLKVNQKIINSNVINSNIANTKNAFNSTIQTTKKVRDIRDVMVKQKQNK